MSGITINPSLTSNAAGSFNRSSQGLMQGMMFDDPAVRNFLAGGILAASEALPMWGGVGISEFVPGAAPGGGASAIVPELGPQIKRATSITAATGGQSNNGQLTGFSVFNQAHAMISSPQSQVPLAAPGGQVNFFRMGSGARIAVRMSPLLVDAEGYLVSSLFSWDFTAQELIPYRAAHASVSVTGAAWAAGIVTVTTGAAHGLLVGDVFDIIDADPAALDGPHDVLTVADATHLTFALADDPGAYVGSGVIPAGGGAVNVRVLKVQVGNSMTVEYDSATNFANWDRSGSAAIILI